MQLLVLSLSVCCFMQVTAQFQIRVVYFNSFRTTVEAPLQFLVFVKCLPTPAAHQECEILRPSSRKGQWNYWSIPAVDLNLLTRWVIVDPDVGFCVYIMSITVYMTLCSSWVRALQLTEKTPNVYL